MVVTVLTDQQRIKEDNADDCFFYSTPRLVHHLDDGFRKRLTQLYREQIAEDSIILDLMSSWVSHLPDDKQYKRVIGHGLNIEELERNTRLDSFWIQDFNKKQGLPLEDKSIDVCVMVAAWQYLQYPEKIASELKRIIKPKGKLIISFSNRAFWTKAPRVWREGSSFDHIKYIQNVLVAQGWPMPNTIIDETKGNQILPFFLGNGDPFFSILATNN